MAVKPFTDRELVTQKIDFTATRTSTGGSFQNLIIKGNTASSTAPLAPPPSKESPLPVSTQPKNDDAATVRVRRGRGRDRDDGEERSQRPERSERRERRVVPEKRREVALEARSNEGDSAPKKEEVQSKRVDKDA